jgi:predicted ATP-grasp superfamily ATP-dependent carboligase
LEGFVTTLLRIARTGRYFAIFPLGDNSLLPVSEHRDQLTPCLKLVLPSHESVLKALDKSKTLRIAEEVGIPIPETFHARNTAEVINVSTRIQYPAVIKPRQSYVWGRNGKANYSRPFYVNSASELISTYAKVEKNFPAPLIQEYVPGHNISVALLFDHGEPVTGGTSVLRESIPPDPTLLRYASDLLRNLDWHGVAEVEFKLDSRDSTPKLMEINARFWGSMIVAIESGVDFPYLMYLLAKGEHVLPVFNYKIGVKCRWLIGDVQNLCSTLRGEQKPINSESTNKAKTVLDFLKFYEKNMHYDGFTMSDPLPFFMDQVFYTYVTTRNSILGVRAQPAPYQNADEYSVPLLTDVELAPSRLARARSWAQ